MRRLRIEAAQPLREDWALPLKDTARMGLGEANSGNSGNSDKAARDSANVRRA